MTPEDQALNPGLFTDLSSSIKRPLLLFGIAKARYANLSGAGSAIAPGRWNVVGEEAIYTYIEVAAPQLEKLVHTPKDRIPSNLALMTIHFKGDGQVAAAEEPEDADLRMSETLASQSILRANADESRVQVGYGPADGAQNGIFPTLASARKALTVALPSLKESWNVLAVALPSVVAPAWNFVLFPGARGGLRGPRRVKQRRALPV